MTDTEPCRAELTDLAYPYAMDAVAEIERRHIENRLAGADFGTAAAFAVAVRGIRETLAALSGAEAVNPPPTLESKILRAIDDSAPAARRGRRDLREVFRRRRVLRLAVAAAVVIGVGTGSVVVAERIARSHAASVTADQILGQPNARSREIPLPSGGRLTISTSDQLGAVAITFDAVPEPPPGRAYQLWLVSAAGAARSVGVLTTVPPLGVATGFDPAEALAVTIEPATGSAEPTSPRLGTVALS
ncbi:anti-sigma factor [Streptomyces gardneri]|nr:anti-sigma factor [Streptomyces gardneri]MBF6204262.1 anti-sigma factor [Streptomyces gardneri]